MEEAPEIKVIRWPLRGLAYATLPTLWVLIGLFAVWRASRNQSGFNQALYIGLQAHLFNAYILVLVYAFFIAKNPPTFGRLGLLLTAKKTHKIQDMLRRLDIDESTDPGSPWMRCIQFGHQASCAYFFVAVAGLVVLAGTFYSVIPAVFFISQTNQYSSIRVSYIFLAGAGGLLITLAAFSIINVIRQRPSVRVINALSEIVEMASEEKGWWKKLSRREAALTELAWGLHYGILTLDAARFRKSSHQIRAQKVRSSVLGIRDYYSLSPGKKFDLTPIRKITVSWSTGRWELLPAAAEVRRKQWGWITRLLVTILISGAFVAIIISLGKVLPPDLSKYRDLALGLTPFIAISIFKTNGPIRDSGGSSLIERALLR